MSVIVIGGTSHVGKSTLAANLAEALDWSLLSTDSLARHPGRPWPVVRPHVAEFYEHLSAAAIFRFLLDHHRNMWPGIQNLILQHGGRAYPDSLVLEGSALRPEFVAELSPEIEIDAVWLTANDAFIVDRIRRNSDFDGAPVASQRLIQRFIDRSLADNARIIDAVTEHGLRNVDVEDSVSLAAFRKGCVAQHTP